MKKYHLEECFLKGKVKRVLRPCIWSPVAARRHFGYILLTCTLPAYPLSSHFHRHVKTAGAMQPFPLLAICSHVTGWKHELKLEIRSFNLQFFTVSWLHVFILKLMWVIKMKKRKSYNHQKSYIQGELRERQIKQQ